jgi:Tat-targeted selenate reductase subunit YnfH
MGSGWHEWPLVLFTVWAMRGRCVNRQWVRLVQRGRRGCKSAIVRSMFFWVVMGIGFIASVLHLGSPMRL